ncbi:flagellar hook protein FlgE [Syntrophorhabdus aromaticivorans]|uniref:Flagellar hook protein FlgE n=1 Tax=Syntrophorhabdus aromaticivorans TaxID=328301 RepID=A0A971M5U0_9BACT|nr:flagellar hook protein FlgE [Syntrophorhabdus aromaticivorans]NLW36344.1 flagellar hook protein FlgE [Syntrophorhabdus aromaticivorans]
MLSSFFSGISGLMANSYGINVVGNNIANVNTIGYKGARTTFQDVLYQSVFGTAGTSQIGRGAALMSVDTLFSQGSFESTSEPTDLAIGGKGFFKVKSPDNNSMYYTRAGQFRFDKVGNLINPGGYLLQGRHIDSVTHSPFGVDCDIVISPEPSQPKASTFVAMACNLQQDAEPPADPFVADDPDPRSYNYTSSVTVYDSIGQSHTLSVYFVKTADNTWDWHAVAPDAIGGVFEDTGTLSFTAQGLLDPGSGAPVPLDIEYQAGITQTIRLAFDGSLGGNATTQYPMASTTNFQTQDGYPPGVLQNVTVSPEGVISGHYSNGQILDLYQLTLANFNNPQGLSREGGNLFAETLESGVPYTNAPGQNGLGKINPNSLEQANVDLASEFVKMIISQRGFQANSRVITTTDEILGELMNLKR